MLVHRRIQHRRHVRLAAAAVMFAVTVVVPFQAALALITGGRGNRPIHDPGWPSGAAAVFNHTTRVAWWEGPPFGGGQWHAECRGDAEAFSAILADFAKVNNQNKRLVLHDGVGSSFWLNPNSRPEKRDAARIDWRLMVWVPVHWARLQTMPADLNPTDWRDVESGPPMQIDVYTGGNLHWADVKVPEGIDLVDQRLETHGYTLADGVVIEGNVIDLETQRPIDAAVRIERTVRQRKGGRRYETVREATTDQNGHWVLKNTPAGYHRVVVAADRYVSRVAGHLPVDDQPGWHQFDCGLSRPAPVSGQVNDADGQPLEGVTVKLGDVATSHDGRYESPDRYEAKTDAAGRFRIEQVPLAEASVCVHKPGYSGPGVGQSIVTPADDVTLIMTTAGRIRVAVDFRDAQRPEQYMVELEPVGGLVVGSWGGSATVDQNNQVAFENVPPGKYVLHGHPNPTSDSQRTDPVTVELAGGQTSEVTLKAKW